jgi:hypothetical protein
MIQSIAPHAPLATADEAIEQQIDQALHWLRPQLVDLARAFRSGPCTPTAFLQFELALLGLARAFCRLLLEGLLNSVEADGASLPHDVLHDGQGYRRLGKRTRNAHVATLFGVICLWRFPYRFWEPQVKQPCIFPLELQLGLIEGATPALADLIGQRMAEAGATQGRVLERLRKEQGVSIGVPRLRKVVAALSERLAEHRQAVQVQTLLSALQTADSSQGDSQPVLAVGRDGITLRDYKYRFWEVATTATVTVFDRSGKRLASVYLAWRPELGQAAMSRMLTELLTETLLQWQGPLPVLAYVADSGGNESSYFEDTLAWMRHPRTNERLRWQRVVDFYHAAQRVWTMAEALFGKGTNASWKWAHRMLRLLKTKPRGAKRVLHSAAYFAARHKMSAARAEEYRKACNYLRKRTRWMRYSEYKQRHIPLGSGITEAACKTVFTQRLKLSGMRWTWAGAQNILTLRVILLSGAWQRCYARSLTDQEAALPTPYVNNSWEGRRNAA